MPELQVAIPRPKRWAVPFGDATSEAAVDQLLAIEPFRSIDANAFPPSLSLRDILRGDTRMVTFESGDLIVREGDYGHSAFLILAGNVRVCAERLNPELLGREQPPKRSWRQAVAQLWENAKFPEVRRAAAKAELVSSEIGRRDSASGTRVFLQDVPRLLEHTGTVQLGPGEIFGEMAALARSPRTATVFAEGPARLLEIRWQGLRDLMRFTPAIRDHVEQLYRVNSLRVHLRETPLLAGLPEDALNRVAEAAQFESYGSFDWYADFGPERPADANALVASEPLIAAEGEPPAGLILIRSGFARMSRRHGHGHRTLAYLGKGQVFGLSEIRDAHIRGVPVPLQNSLRAVGYVDVVVLPLDAVVEAVLPSINPSLTAVGASNETSSSSTDNGAQSVDARRLGFFSDHRFFNGTHTMLINLDRCTRCDDCVRACAATHDNNPRFVRDGAVHDGLMVANACMHCVDPVCMIGCPTGAIGRDADTGTVRINDRTCVGCATCANSCPYDAIRMVETREPGGAFLVDERTGQAILKATKCDFCAGQLTGPACQNACPHDALARMDMSDMSALTHWLGRS
jgi:Fe-S-cluster-containing dehydrogenase component/CRP-like cAMP-binding protein